MKKISIIMVCKNSSLTIDKSITSFLNQKYLNKELIIVDGGSKDQTIKIIKKFKKKNIKFFKKKNLGLYPSINYGIKRSSGEIVGTLHSDDMYTSSEVLTKVCKNFNLKKYDALYTNIFLIDKRGSIIRKWVNSKIKNFSKIESNLPPHTGLYVKKKVFDLIGYYNEKYKISSDIEFMFKLFLNKNLKKKKIKTIFFKYVNRRIEHKITNKCYKIKL